MNLLLGPLSPLLFLSFLLCLFSRSLLRSFLGCGNTGHNVVEWVVDDPD